MGFDKSRLMNNISELIKERGRKIGEIEDVVGVSKGYLSRMSKADNETMPGVDLIYRLACELDVSLDTLVCGDFGRSNDNLFYMIKFLYRLKLDTDLHDLIWTKDTSFYGENSDEYIFHPLFEFDDFIRAEDSAKIKTYRYKSPFLPDASIGINGNCYYAWSEEFGDMYLMNLMMSNGENNITKFFELVSVSDAEVIPICCTLSDVSLKEAILDLFNCIERHDKDLKIDDRARTLMSIYMNRHTEDLPFN